MYQTEDKAFLKFPQYITPVNVIEHDILNNNNDTNVTTGIWRPQHYKQCPFEIPNAVQIHILVQKKVAVVRWIKRLLLIKVI